MYTRVCYPGDLYGNIFHRNVPRTQAYLKNNNVGIKSLFQALTSLWKYLRQMTIAITNNETFPNVDITVGVIIIITGALYHIVCMFYTSHIISTAISKCTINIKWSF